MNSNGKQDSRSVRLDAVQSDLDIARKAQELRRREAGAQLKCDHDDSARWQLPRLPTYNQT